MLSLLYFTHVCISKKQLKKLVIKLQNIVAKLKNIVIFVKRFLHHETFNKQGRGDHGAFLAEGVIVREGYY